MTNHPSPQADRPGRRDPYQPTMRKGRRHGPRLRAPFAGPGLTAEELDELWAAYLADRSELRLRNRLVEHYLPWVGDLAGSIAGQMRLRDRENAVGEVLAALVAYIVPDYSGHGSFQRWACICIKRKLIALQRAEQVGEAVGDVSPGGGGLSALELLPGQEERRRGDLSFDELTAELSDRQAVVLWLRHCRSMRVEAVAELLNASTCSVKVWTREGLAELKKLWHDYP
jgi:RNA polymerase sigma factor (sigma-70 family)